MSIHLSQRVCCRIYAYSLVSHSYNVKPYKLQASNMDFFMIYFLYSSKWNSILHTDGLYVPNIISSFILQGRTFMLSAEA